MRECYRPNSVWIVWFTVFTLITTGCTSQVLGVQATQPAIQAYSESPAVKQPTLTPFTTGTLSPSATLTPAIPALTPTQIATSTPTPDPMSIAALRRGTYPGSDIVIVKELTAAIGYHRYYAYYLSQGLKIYGLLTVPNGDPPQGGWPAIVFNHGYIPPKQYVTTERYVAYVDYLARAGYIVYKIDYRGNGNSEGVAKGAYGDPGYTIDVLNAVASIKRFPQVNPQKIGIWGHSMGGFLTLRAMVISKDIKVGVIWSGVVGSYPDLVDIWHHNDLYTPTPQPNSPNWTHKWFDLYGSPQENPQFWKSISATSYLADLSGPLQLHHDTGDSEVPYVFSESLAKGIHAVGGTVEFYSYPGDDHNLANSFGLAMSRTIAFFDKYMK
ncbi:MAG: alpha/beta fold hydrolase [Anaerolineaceae bacterium]|jgi:dipeptidyl aminopeptidase/acylaminoacyl peptidase